MRTWEELSEKEQLLTYISDVHKDARGFRPRGMYNDYSVPELKKVLDDLSEEAHQEALRIERLGPGRSLRSTFQVLWIWALKISSKLFLGIFKPRIVNMKAGQIMAFIVTKKVLRIVRKGC